MESRAGCELRRGNPQGAGVGDISRPAVPGATAACDAGRTPDPESPRSPESRSDELVVGSDQEDVAVVTF